MLLFTLTSCYNELVGDQYRVVEVTENYVKNRPRYRIKVVSIDYGNRIYNTYIYTDSLYKVGDIIKITK